MLRVYIALSAVSVPAVTSAQASTQPAPELGSAMKNAGIGEAQTCKTDDSKAVVVCGRRSERFRIDRQVLESDRAATAQPGRPSLMQEALTAQRYGDHPEHGRVIPNKLIALPLGKGSSGAPELAIKGQNLPVAMRQGDDTYLDYRAARVEPNPRY